MAMLSNLDLIRRVPLFAMLTPAQAESLAGAVSKQRYKRGECIVSQGDKLDSLYIILSGRARVVLTDNKARQVILSTLHPGDYVGEMSLIDREPHSASVEAEVQTDVLVLGDADFTRCLLENVSVMVAVMKGLVQRLRSADRKIESLALTGVFDRVAQVLLDSAAPDANNIRHLKDKISRQDLARMVGASREMVSRVMKDLEEQGFIETLADGSLLIKERRKLPRQSP